MAKHLYIFIISILLMSMAACDLNKKEKAQQFSNDITVINDSLAYYVKDWVEEFKVSVNTKDFSQLHGIRQGLEGYLDRKTTYLQGMEDRGGSEQLRTAELDYLAFEKNTVSRYLSVFEQFDSTTTDDQIAKAYNTSMANVGGEEQKILTINKLQDEYAEKNDFPKPVRP